MKQLIVIAHNLRSAHNVGSLLRTADGLGVSKVYFTGYTPYPISDSKSDPRLPHIANKINKNIAKISLGAEASQAWEHIDDIAQVIDQLKAEGYTVAALEQTDGSIQLPEYKPAEKLAIIVGREVEGVEPEVIALTDLCLEIPMLGQKESYNVAVASAMALYHCRFH